MDKSDKGIDIFLAMPNAKFNPEMLSISLFGLLRKAMFSLFKFSYTYLA